MRSRTMRSRTRSRTTGRVSQTLCVAYSVERLDKHQSLLRHIYTSCRKAASERPEPQQQRIFGKLKKDNVRRGLVGSFSKNLGLRDEGGV